MRKILIALAISVFFVTNSIADVTINEIRVSQPSTDTDNFWELAGAPGESLAGLSLITISGEFEPGLIEFAYDLDGFMIPTDGFFLAHQTGTPDTDIITGDDYFGSPTNFLVVSGFTGLAGDDIDTDNDGTADVMPWSSVIDGVLLIDDDGIDFAYGGATPVGPDGTFTPAHLFRYPNGSGAWNVGDFGDLSFDTPGAANIPEPTSGLLLLVSALGLGFIRRK